MLRLGLPFAVGVASAANTHCTPTVAGQYGDCVRRACWDWATMKRNTTFAFCDPAKPVQERSEDIVKRLSLGEKPALMTARHSAPIDRLGIPAYDWGVNSIHGTQVACGTRCATNFPLPVAIGAAFNVSMVEALSTMMAVEQRALRLEHSYESHRRLRVADQLAEAKAPPDATIGLDTWAPNINLNRDPRWGRNWETATEDPFLDGQIGAAYARGFQTLNGNKFLTGIITLKHWAAYTVEADRAGSNAAVAPFDLQDSYLPAFRAAVTEGHAAGVMCSYNALNGVPTCANSKLTQILRRDWAFEGYITSDSGAIGDISGAHRFARNATEGTAMALKAGCDINSGRIYSANVKKAVDEGLLAESVVDAALVNAFKIRIRLGLFDPPTEQPTYAPELVFSAANQELSLEASRQGLTLLSNKKAALPLSIGKYKQIAVIGPNSLTKNMMIGGTGGGLLGAQVVCVGAQNRSDFRCLSNPFDAIQAAAGKASTVSTAQGCRITGPSSNKTGQGQAVALAAASDAVILVIGGDWSLEHEGIDRKSIELPGGQNALVKAVRAALKPGVPLVAVMVHGGSMDISTVLSETDAVLDAFYPGQFGAKAIAETLFGLSTPGGKLPYTYYKAAYTDTIKMSDFSCATGVGRGYRYMKPDDKNILLPFGHGKSYTTFDVALRWPKPGAAATLDTSDASAAVNFTFTVKNSGAKYAGSETVMAFYKPHNRTNSGGAELLPLQRRLFGFAKVGPLQPGEQQQATISATVARTAMVDAAGSLVSIPGTYDVILSTGSDTAKDITAALTVKGTYAVLEMLPPGI